MKIEATLKDLRENSSLVNARACIRLAGDLDKAIEAARTAAIEDTAHMSDDKVSTREGIMKVAESMMAVKYIECLNDALAHLERIAIDD